MALVNKTITELITDIERGRIALPDMQREFVWDNTQIRDLVDSLYKNHPVGMILLWQTAPSDNVPVTTIDDITKEISEYSELVIDGQQRLTSLYLVKHGTIFKGGKERKVVLLFNPETEEFEVEIPRIKKKLEWINITDLVNGGEYQFREVFKKIGWDEDKIFQIMKRMSEVRNIFVGSRNSIPVFSISSAMNYEEVADIFVKINSKGTRIRITELLLALLALKIPGEFRKDFRQHLDELEDRGWELDASVLIRSLVAVAAKQGRLAYFRGLAKNISKEDLIKNWDITKKAIDDCFMLLDQNLGIRTINIMPSQNVLVPLVYYLSRKTDKFTEEEAKDFSLWFILASFWGRYAGSPETRIDEDIRDIDKTHSLKNLFQLLKNQVGRLNIDEERFTGKSRNSKLLLYVVSRNEGAEDWWKGHKITTTDYEEHHIVPRSLLKKAGYEFALIDDAANIAFLSEKANRKILNTNPEKYLSEIDPKKLKKQFLPLNENLWKTENYEEFLINRRRIIIQKINEYLKFLGIEKYL
jgi:hypothetical protein